MSIVRLKLLFLAMLLGANPFRAAAEPVIVYDNSTDYSGMDYVTTNEHGDEVILDGTARVITEFQFEYYADFIRQGDELARVRFYANTGPLWENDPDYATPALPPLWDFTFQISTGYQTAVISVPSIRVPDKFTWTVEFLGLSQRVTAPADEAGLLMYGSAFPGTSFDDFWERLPSGWAPLARSDVPKNNFGARILAVTPNAEPQLTIRREPAGLRISWNFSSRQYHLESKPALTAVSWTRVAAQPTLNGSRYEVVVPFGTGNQFFQLSSLP